MTVVFDIGAVLIDFDWDAFVGSMFDAETAAAVTRAMWRNPDWTELDKGILRSLSQRSRVTKKRYGILSRALPTVRGKRKGLFG